MSKVWYTADLHLMHRMVAKTRGFDDPAEHDAAILDHWREVVGPRDVVHVLGDLALAKHTKVLPLLEPLPGYKRLVTGNHDYPHPSRRDHAKFERAYGEVFESVQPFSRRRIGGRDVLLSHFPYRGDHTAKDRYVQYRLRDEGLPLLHGHTHSDERVSGRMIHVGLDAWGLRLVPEEAVIDLLDQMEP